MGLWKPVYVHITKGISIHYPLIQTVFLAEDYSEADLDIMIEVTNERGYPITGTVVASLPTISGKEFTKQVTIAGNAEVQIWLKHEDY